MTVDFSAIPAAVAEALTITEFSAEILVSIFVVMLIVVITAIFTRDPVILIIMTLLGLTLDIALGWLDYWVLFVIALLIALAYSNKITDMIGGLGGS